MKSRGPALLAALALSLLLPAAAHASAANAPLLPGPETGLITVLGGVRYVPQGPLQSSALKAGWKSVDRWAVTPAVAVPFSYRVDADWTALVEFDWSTDQYRFRNDTPPENASADGRFSLHTAAVLIGGQRTFHLGWRRIEPYLGFGLGYYLSAVKLEGSLGALPKQFEAHTGGGYLAAGLRIGLGGGWLAVVEERYAFATAGLADFGAVTVGGNTVSLGVGRVWR